MKSTSSQTDSYLEQEQQPTVAPTNVFPINGKTHRIIVAPPQLDWWKIIEDRLQHLLHLKKGWDGYLAPAVRFQNAHFAATVLSKICTGDTPPPQIVPGPNGDLQIEWHSGSAVLELHIVEPNNVNAWYCDETTGDDGVEKHITVNFAWVVNILEKIRDRTIDQDQATAAG